MKKVFLTLVFVVSFIAISFSQLSFGLGASYHENVGVQARSRIDVGNFDLIPKATFYLVDGATSYSFDVDAAYNIVTFSDEHPLYVFGGLAYYRQTINDIGDGDIGFNIGVGLEVKHIYGEIKYTNIFCEGCDGQVGFAAGYMF